MEKKEPSLQTASQKSEFGNSASSKKAHKQKLKEERRKQIRDKPRRSKGEEAYDKILSGQTEFVDEEALTAEKILGEDYGLKANYLHSLRTQIVLEQNQVLNKAVRKNHTCEIYFKAIVRLYHLGFMLEYSLGCLLTARFYLEFMDDFKDTTLMTCLLTAIGSLENNWIDPKKMFEKVGLEFEQKEFSELTNFLWFLSFNEDRNSPVCLTMVSRILKMNNLSSDEETMGNQVLMAASLSPEFFNYDQIELGISALDVTFKKIKKPKLMNVAYYMMDINFNHELRKNSSLKETVPNLIYDVFRLIKKFCTDFSQLRMVIEALRLLEIKRFLSHQYFPDKNPEINIESLMRVPSEQPYKKEQFFSIIPSQEQSRRHFHTQ